MTARRSGAELAARFEDGRTVGLNAGRDQGFAEALRCLIQHLAYVWFDFVRCERSDACHASIMFNASGWL
jgi:hypothetical protein